MSIAMRVWMALDNRVMTFFPATAPNTTQATVSSVMRSPKNR